MKPDGIAAGGRGKPERGNAPPEQRAKNERPAAQLIGTDDQRRRRESGTPRPPWIHAPEGEPPRADRDDGSPAAIVERQARPNPQEQAPAGDKRKPPPLRR